MKSSSKRAWLAVALSSLALGVAACGGSDDDNSSDGAAGANAAGTPPTPKSDASDGFKPGAPEAGTEIPKVEVKFGQRPYADNTFWMIGMEKGWFEEAGITAAPKPYGIKNSDNAVSMMLKRQVDVQAMFGPTLIPTMKTDTSLKMISFSHLFGGWAIFANPDLNLKSVKEYMEEGLEFREAMKQTLAPLAGKELVVAPLVDARGFVRLSFELAGAKQPKLKVLDDSKSLVLAKSKRVNFATPTGAPITLEFERQGYKMLVTPFDILDNMPGDPEGEHELLVQTVGAASNADYINENPNTILRTVGVIWRILEEIEKNPEDTLGMYAPYLNSVAGTQLKPEDIEGLFKGLTPMIRYENMPDYCEKTDGTLYYKNAYGAILKDYVKQGLIEDKFTPDDLIWTCQIYETAKWYKDQTESLLADLDEGSLSGDKQELVTKAKDLLGKFNFLDAYRHAAAASAA